VDDFSCKRDAVLQGGNYMRAASFILLASILTLVMPPATAAAADTREEELRVAKEWNRTAEQYMDRGEYEEARKLYLRSLPILENTAGLEHPATAAVLGNLCIASSHSVSLDAMPLCRRALSVREKVYGPDHPEVARSLSDLGLLCAKEGDLAHAESLLRKALRIDSSLPDSPDIPGLLNNLGFLDFKQKKYSLAEDMFQRAIDSTEKERGPEDSGLIAMLGNLATVNLAHHDPRAAEEHFRRALAIAEQCFGRDQITSMRPLIGLARAEAALGKRSQAAVFPRARPQARRERPAGLHGMGWGAGERVHGRTAQVISASPTCPHGRCLATYLIHYPTSCLRPGRPICKPRVNPTITSIKPFRPTPLCESKPLSPSWSKRAWWIRRRSTN
jgi:tetratricopeptide (TPR) repeat protein